MAWAECSQSARWDNDDPVLRSCRHWKGRACHQRCSWASGSKRCAQRARWVDECNIGHVTPSVGNIRIQSRIRRSCCCKQADATGQVNAQCTAFSLRGAGCCAPLLCLYWECYQHQNSLRYEVGMSYPRHNMYHTQADLVFWDMGYMRRNVHQTYAVVLVTWMFHNAWCYP